MKFKFEDPNVNNPSILLRFFTSYGGMSQVCAFLEKSEVLKLQQLSRWQYHVNIPRILKEFCMAQLPFSSQTKLLIHTDSFRRQVAYDTSSRIVSIHGQGLVGQGMFRSGLPDKVLRIVKVCRISNGTEFLIDRTALLMKATNTDTQNLRWI